MCAKRWLTVATYKRGNKRVEKDDEDANPRPVEGTQAPGRVSVDQSEWLYGHTRSTHMQL